MTAPLPTPAAPRPVVATRSAVGLLGCGAALLLLLPALAAALGPDGWAGLAGRGRRADEVLVVLLAAAGSCLAAWLTLGCVLGLLATLPGAVGWWSAQLADRLTPRLVRQALTVALTTSTASLALPAATVVASAAPTGTAPFAGEAHSAEDPTTSAAAGPGYRPTTISPTTTTTTMTTTTATDMPATAGPAWTVAPSRTVTSGPGPGYRPSRPVRAHDPSSTDLLTRPPRPASALLEEVTVRRGDTLWSIAAHHLGHGAGDAEIAREWPRWYAANRAVIGLDPDLIQPGTQLVPPTEGDSR